MPGPVIPLPSREQLLAATLSFETRTRSVRPFDNDGGPVVYRHATADGYDRQRMAETDCILASVNLHDTWPGDEPGGESP